MSRPLVIAHRGASAYRPENTLPAYELAIEQRADMIEIDLHAGRDGEIVVAHDAGLERLGADGEIADRELAELRALDVGEGEMMPRLGEVLEQFGHRVPFNLEIKQGSRGRYAGLERRTLEALGRLDLLEPTLFSSFYDDVLRELRGLSPGARLATLVSPRHPERAFERAAAVRSEAINPHVFLANAEFVAEAHQRGLAVYVYTVDDVDQMQRLLDLGVDGLFTNRPDRMRALVDAPAGIA